MVYLILPFILILFGGIFTASETGFISIDRMKVLRAKREKKMWALRTSKFIFAPERFFSTTLLCENFIIVVASTLFTTYFIDYFGISGAIISTVSLSLFSLIIGQFIPKSMALANPERTMMLFSSLIYYVEVITYPIVHLFATLSKSIAHFFRGDTKAALIRRLDIVYAMSEYEETSSRFASRLFNFSRRIVAEVMIPLDTAFLCKKGSEIETIEQREGRIYTRIPVYKEHHDNIVGYFNIKDYFYTNKVTLRKPFFVQSDERCMSIFLTMKQKGEHIAIVRDKTNHTVGIVTLEDLIEELVGEIRDEK
jgi:putative hemolysin